MNLSPVFVAQSVIDSAWNFFAPGGIFMILLAICSVIGFGAILFKLLTLKESDVVPDDLANALLDGSDCKAEVGRGDSVLARLCGQVDRFGPSVGSKQKRQAIEALAREEIVSLHNGVPLLEIVITIAPLLGILGTASGLVQVFGNFADANSQEAVADGIGRALSTTIVGLAVAVPAVIAHVSFTRKIERMAARLEVILEAYLLSREAPAETPRPLEPEVVAGA
mgnify:CR=1 FL=1